MTDEIIDNIGQKLKVLRSERFNLLVSHKGIFYKIFNIVFTQNKKKGFAIRINFPYLDADSGILSKMCFPANQTSLEKISLVPTGRLTTKYIKYSHWEDGGAHFSQCSQIFTDQNLKNKTFPLDKTADHIFTIENKLLIGFEVKGDSLKETEKETDIHFDLTKGKRVILKYTGWWFNGKNLKLNQSTGGPQAAFRLSNGKVKNGFCIAPPKWMKFSSAFLYLTCEIRLENIKSNKPYLFFLGAFDENIKNINENSYFLTFKYPAGKYNQLLTKIPSIDFQRN